MALKLKGSTSGFVAIDAPSVAGNNTLILPENNGSAQQLLGNDITAGVVTFTSVTVNRNGDLTVPGTISIGGTLTYEDVTSVDSVGIVTARSGVRINGGGLTIIGDTTGINATGISTLVDVSARNITGVAATFTGNVAVSGANITLQDSGGATDDRISIGAGGDLHIYHNGTDSYVSNATGDLNLFSVGGNADDVIIRAQDDIELQPNNGQAGIKVIGTGTVELYHNNSKKLDTDSEGISVTGTVKINNTSAVGDYNGGADDMLIGTHSGNHGMTILSGTSNGGYIMFSDNNGGGTNAYRGQIEYAHSSDYMRFMTSSTERMRIRGWGDVNISNKLNVAGIVTTTALTVSGATTPVTINHTGGNAMHLTRSSKTLGFNANYGAGDVKSQIDVSSGMGLALSVADNEKIRMTSGGNFNIGGDYAQTSSKLYIKGGTGGGGNFNGLEIKHSNTSSSAGAGDGPAILLNGYYSSSEWQFAKICSVNSGSGFGADFQIHVHPSDGSQSASLVKAVSIVGNGSAGNLTIHNGTLYTTYDGDSFYGAQINDSKTSGTHIQFQRQGYNNGNITHTTNSCAYNTTGSDRTLKKNFEDWTEDTLTLFKNLKPQKFNFTIEDDGAAKTKGYIAQDLVDSFPEAYPKEVKSDKYMFNPSGMVPYLMKALQEEIAKREALEARVAALEG